MKSSENVFKFLCLKNFCAFVISRSTIRDMRLLSLGLLGSYVPINIVIVVACVLFNIQKPLNL